MARNLIITPYKDSVAAGEFPKIEFQGKDASVLTIDVQDDGSVRIFSSSVSYVMNWNSSGVGIGTNSSTQKLNVGGSIIADGTIIAAIKTFVNTLTTNTTLSSDTASITIADTLTIQNGITLDIIGDWNVIPPAFFHTGIKLNSNNNITEISRTFTPNADNVYDLGSSTNRWANIYSTDLQLSNEGGRGNEVDLTTGSWTIQEGKDDLYIINRNNGKKYRFKLEEIK